MADMALLLKRLPLLLALVSLGACGRDKIEIYTIPKESTQPLPVSKTSDPHTGHKEIEWQTPTGWVEQAPSSMRVGSFLIKGDQGQQADVSIIPLEGEAGTDLSNINRWRGQIGLGDLDESELQQEASILSPSGRQMVLVDFANQEKRVVAAIYRQQTRTWFFKMSGGDDIVGKSKPSFMKLLESLKFHEH